MPSESWPEAVMEALKVLAGLEDWRMDLSEKDAVFAGITRSKATKSQIADRLRIWATQYNFSLASKIAAGPRVLAEADVAAILRAGANCGLLSQSAAAGDTYALGDTVGVTGTLADDGTADRIKSQLTDAIGDRKLQFDVSTLNADLCVVRNVLPVLPSNALSIWFGDGDTGAANISGIFQVNENPIVEVLAPADMSGLSLWVVAVDNTGKIFNLLPNINFEEHAIDRIGVVENGIRRVRVLFSIAEFKSDPRLVAMRISKTDFGKSEIIAILSKDNLFGIRRPRDESVASFAEALAEIQVERPGNIIGIANRLLDSRP
jgi:hypothetical protein